MSMLPKTLIIEATKRTPWVILEPGRIFIMGRSIPENPGEFFRPVQDWLTQYASEYKDESKIILGFEYINTSSIKWVFTILRGLSEMEGLENKANVTWYYEQGDDDLSELGFIIRSLVDCPFLLIEVDDMNMEKYQKILSDSSEPNR